jgi:Glycosyl hydrolase family 1
MRRPVLIAVLAVAAAAAHVASASAAPGIQYGIQDDAWLVDGPGTLERRLDLVESLGVTTVRFGIHWDQIAPTRPARALASNDPAYHWSSTDAVLQGLRARGIEPLVTLYGSAPWANGGRKPNFAPKSSATFADFAYVAAKRYRFVRKWTVWNEPNQRFSLADTSPALYVTRLLNPAYAAIHRANPRALVAGGVTAPRGNRGGFGPLAWVRGLAAAHAKLDAYAHNPYATRPVESPLSGACPYCDVISMANLNRLVKEVRRDLGRKPIWLTEYGYQTNPPDRLFGVKPDTQALYVSESAMRAYQLAGVTTLIQFLVRDEPNLDRFQSGLFNVHGVPKPAYYAFRFPLAQSGRHGSRASLWGQIRPGKGVRSYRLQVHTGSSWRWLGSTQRTSRLGYFSPTVTLPRGSLIRVWSPQQHAYGWPLLIR